jgi:glyoxylase-like metal-dependent hydrolase (beta-lactamase superfamily II)
MSWSRRDFVKVSALGLAGSVLAGPSNLRGRMRAEFVPLRRNVGIFTERGGTIGWLMNPDGVAIVDSQFADTAPLLLEGVRQRTQVPIDVLINSHHHPDHVGGNAVLRPAVGRIVAHERSLENQRRVAGRAATPPPEGAFPDVTYTGETSIEVGDETLHLKHYGPAHTGGDTAVFFEQANVVHLGDLLNNHGWPNIDAGAGGTVHGWVQVIEAFLPEYPADAIYIFGHNEAGAPPTGTREDVSFQRDYFLAVIDHAQRSLAAGQSREQATSLTALPGFEFGGTASRLPLAVGIAYDELVAMRR